MSSARSVALMKHKSLGFIEAPRIEFWIPSTRDGYIRSLRAGRVPRMLEYPTVRSRSLILTLVAASWIGLPPAAPPVAAQRGTATPRPAPRWPDGRVNLGAPPGETGLWERR